MQLRVEVGRGPVKPAVQWGRCLEKPPTTARVRSAGKEKAQTEQRKYARRSVRTIGFQGGKKRKQRPIFFPLEHHKVC